MEKSERRFKSLLPLALVFLASGYAAGQLVATKDLASTAPPANSTKQTPPKSPPPVTRSPDNCGDRDSAIMGVRDGAIVREVPERVQLELVSVDPPLVYDGTTIIATVRLKNIGEQPILVPWTTPPVEPDTDPKTGAKIWERATIHLTLGIREDRRRSSYLKGEADLTAAPSNRTQQVELLSGQWVDVKFEAAVECYSPESWACQPLPADGHAQLTAHWWESLSTHEEEGCSVWSGYYESRMAESAPFPISYFASSTSGEKKTAPRR